MKRHHRSIVLLGLMATGGLAAQALAQRPPIIRTPKNLPGLLTSSSGGAPIAVATGSQFPATIPPPPPPPSPFQPGTVGSAHPVTGPVPSELMGAKTPAGGVQVNFSDVDLPDLLQWISGITGRRFIYGAKVRSIKVTLYSPNPVTVDEAYKVFLVALDTNGLTVIPHGRFLKIIETTGGVHGHVTPIYGAGQPVPAEERYITRIYRLHHIGADEATALLNTFKSKEANVTPYAPGNLVIITDTGANIRRLLRLVEEIDVGTAGEQIYVEPVHYGTATEFVQRLNEIFDIKPAAAGAAKGAPTVGDMRITKIIADDRSNSLIIVATERSYLRILEVIKRLDVPITGEGEIHVLPLQHAMAEELAPVLNQILGSGTTAARTAKPAPGATGQAPSVLEGGAKITADKATNSLIITASLRDYAQIRTVIDRLDQPRRQVFIEAVIMDLSVDHSNKLGLGYHAGGAPTLLGNDPSLVYGGFNPLQSIGLPNDPSQLQGLALGVRGPAIDGTSNLLGTGITIPAFGIVLNALATTGDANVLATPHIIATDNVPAEINVGENIPLQTNMGGSLPTGMLGAQAGAATSALGMFGGLGAFGAAPRQDVGTKIKVTPHMNDSNEVRLELQEEISERGASSGALGVVSITKRTAHTSVIVQDQQTVVIGGLMRDAYTSSKRKIPILGDIPLLGALFRSTETAKRKTNLLLVLTPYVIRDQNDLRTVFERKMQERQEFLDRYFVFSDQTQYEPPRDFSRLNGLLEDIRHAYIALDDKKRIVESTRPKDKKTHEPREPLAMPEIHRAPAAAPAAGAPAAPTTPVKPAGTRPPRIGTPSVLSGGVKSTGAAPAPPPPPPPAKSE